MKGLSTMRLSHLVSQYTLLENFSCLCRHHGITTPGAYTCLQHKYMQSRQRVYLRDVCEHIPHQLHPNREFPNDQSPFRGSSNPIEVPFQLPTARWANTDIPYVNLVSELTRPGWWHFSLLLTSIQRTYNYVCAGIYLHVSWYGGFCISNRSGNKIFYHLQPSNRCRVQ